MERRSFTTSVDAAVYTDDTLYASIDNFTGTTRNLTTLGFRLRAGAGAIDDAVTGAGTPQAPSW